MNIYEFYDYITTSLNPNREVYCCVLSKALFPFVIVYSDYTGEKVIFMINEIKGHLGLFGFYNLDRLSEVMGRKITLKSYYAETRQYYKFDDLFKLIYPDVDYNFIIQKRRLCIC